jgi:hypothetical protein
MNYITIEEAKGKIKAELAKYAIRFEELGVRTAIEFSYDTRSFAPCTESDRKLAIMSCDLAIRSASMTNDALFYGVVVDASHKRGVDEEKLETEINITRELLDELISKLETSEDIDAALDAELVVATEESRAAMEEFTKKMKKCFLMVTKTSSTKIMTTI